GHVFRVAAVGTGNRTGALADRSAGAVHGGVATAQHHYPLAAHIHEVLGGLLEPQVTVDVGHQEIQRVVYARQVFTREAALHIGIGTHAHEDGVVLPQQLLHGHVPADLGIEAQLDAHPGEDFPAAGHDGFFQLELGNTEGQQATDFRVAVEHHRADPSPRQHISAAQPRGAGTDDRHALAGRYYLRQVRAPAHGEGGVGNVFLYRADGDRAEVVIQSTGPFAETVLRTDAAADLRQGIGLVRQFRCLEDIAFGNQLQPDGEEVVHRAFPFTVRVAAFQAAVRLLGCFQRLERLVDFDEARLALAQRPFLRVLAAHFDELEVVIQTVCHGGTSLLQCRTWRRHCRISLVVDGPSGPPLSVIAGWPVWS